MRTKFTPGPWHIFPKNELCVESSDGNIAVCNLARCNFADAALIADAPAIYALLDELCTLHESNDGISCRDLASLVLEASGLLAKHEDKP
jgi:hypothetical protein